MYELQQGSLYAMVASQTSGSLLRVNSNAVLVVPPFECAWLEGPDSIQSGCCISFDVKGEPLNQAVP